MIYTSYFANYRNFPKDLKRVSVTAGGAPWWAKIDREALELGPPPLLVRRYKSGLISEGKYESVYYGAVLKELDPGDIFRKYENSIFLCYEKPPSFCHRRLIADWLKANLGVEIKELEFGRRVL